MKITITINRSNEECDNAGEIPRVIRKLLVRIELNEFAPGIYKLFDTKDNQIGFAQVEDEETMTSTLRRGEK